MLARAFLDDPAWVWLIPDAERRARLLPWLFRVGFDVTAADVYDDRRRGRSARRAGCRPAGRRCASARRCARSSRRRCASGRRPARSSRTAAPSRQLRAEVAPGPHWYLAGIGVDPAAQRRGIGGALLRPGIEGAAARRPACGAADEQRGEPHLLRASRIPVVREERDAARMGRGLGYGQDAVRRRRSDSRTATRSPPFAPRPTRSRTATRRRRRAGSPDACWRAATWASSSSSTSSTAPAASSCSARRRARARSTCTSATSSASSASRRRAAAASRR